MHCWRLRERVLDIFEATTGGRVILSAVCIGGVNRDIENTELKAIVDKLNSIKDEYREITNTFLKDTSVKSRLVGVGHLTKEQAEDLCMVGPFARASNVAYDCRMLGRGAYGDLEGFEPILSDEGDCYARCKVRALEVSQSIDIIEELVSKIPDDGIGSKSKLTPPEGAQASSVLEQPRGECHYYARGNGTKNRSYAHAHANQPESRRHGQSARRMRAGRRAHDYPDHRIRASAVLKGRGAMGSFKLGR
ncbi:MAG: hypothetical protein ACLRX5_05805 [Slackia sp.]